MMGGYDLIRLQELPPNIINGDQVSGLLDALHKERPLLLNASPSPDFKTICNTLGLKDCGALLFSPLPPISTDHHGVILLSPYSDHQWSMEDHAFLSSICASIIHLPPSGRTTEVATSSTPIIPSVQNLEGQ